MGEISAASTEQSAGVAQVGEAVTQMDQAIQQNAALVEELAAAASSLKSQAQELVRVVAVFNLGNEAADTTHLAYAASAPIARSTRITGDQRSAIEPLTSPDSRARRVLLRKPIPMRPMAPVRTEQMSIGPTFKKTQFLRISCQGLRIEMATVLRKTLLSLLMLLTLPAAALKDDFQNIDPKVEKILSGIDWDQATTIEVLLQDHDFTPHQLVFTRDKPYILKLKNVGAQAHDMVGGSFFQAIVIKMVNSSNGRVVTPYLKSVHVSSKHEIDIWFVPMRSGQFDFYCSLPGHQEAGMEGEVLIR